MEGLVVHCADVGSIQNKNAASLATGLSQVPWTSSHGRCKRVSGAVVFVYPQVLQMCVYICCFCVSDSLRSSRSEATETLAPSAMAASGWHTCLAW